MEHSENSLAPRNVNQLVAAGKAERLRPPARESYRMSASSKMKEFRRGLESRGFKITKTKGGHWRFEHPNMDGPVFGPDTPSDHRGMKNLLAMLRRKLGVNNDL